MALCKLLIQTQISIFLLLLANKLQGVHSQGQDTTSFSFDTFLPKPVDLTYQGDVTTRDAHRLRLTKLDSLGVPLTLSAGRVLYSKPVQFWKPGKQANFETTLTFYFFRNFTTPAHGLTFFIAPVNSTIPSFSTGGNLGIFDFWGSGSNLFAVEFDTYSDLWDPPYRHIGIDINSRESKNTTRFDDMVGKEITARIKYEARTRELSVVATTNIVAATSSSPYYSVRYSHNLKNVLRQQVQVGISAATGVLFSAHHELSFWSFTSTLVNDTIGENNQEDDAYIDNM